MGDDNDKKCYCCPTLDHYTMWIESFISDLITFGSSVFCTINQYRGSILLKFI